MVSASTGSRLGEGRSVEMVDGGELGDVGALQTGELLRRMPESEQCGDGVVRRQMQHLARRWLLAGEHRREDTAEADVARREQDVVHEGIDGRAADDALAV